MHGRRPAARPGAPRALALLLALALPGQAQKGPAKPPEAPRPATPARVEPFLGDLDAARRSALDRNAPLVFLALLEGEETSDRVRDELYKGADFARAAQAAVVLVLNDGKHAPKKVPVVNEAGETVERSVCSVYETPSCSDHTRNMNRVYQEYHVGGEMKMPHLLVLLPDGKIQGRLFDEIRKGAALQLLSDAQAAAGPSITEAQLGTVQAELSGLRASERSLDYIEAWRAAGRVLAIASAGVHAEAARAGSERALAALRADLKAARDLLEQGKVEDGYGRLRKLAEGLAETPLAKESGDALQAAERDKRWKEEIAGLKRRAEAEGLWEECLAALEADKLPAAERLAARILKRYAGTPAAARAAERFPELARDP